MSRSTPEQTEFVAERSTSALIAVTDLTRSYPRGGVTVEALRGVTFVIDRSSFVAIMGPSGSGKSTLLHLLGCLDRPTAGNVVINGIDLSRLNDDDASDFRRRHIGFVFQFFNLVPSLKAWENVALPAMLDGTALSKLRLRAEELLSQVGLSDRSLHRPGEMSGGELQRVAVARALMADPPVVLADEPTGNLDSVRGAEILEILLTASSGRTVVLATHDHGIAEQAHRVLELRDGRLVTEGS